MKCIEDEIPFEVPEGWEWCRFVTICPYGEAEKVETNTISDDEWILDLEDIEKNTGKILYYATKKERNAVSTKHRFFQGQLLYSKLRPYLNKVVIAPKDGYCTSEILPLKLYGNISPQYIQIFLMSPTFLAHVNMLSYGVKMPRLGTDDGKQVLIALPPLNEQHSIVERYMETISFVEKLESTCNDFSTQIDLVKSKILDLAIRGQLVPQDPNDEQASVLLDRIRAEKEELIKAGKIKRDKKESVIFKGEDNSYYQEIPKGWELCAIADIAEVITGGTPSKANKDYYGGDFPFFKPADLDQGINTVTPTEWLSESGKLCSRIIPAKSTLVCCIGTIGKSGYANVECATNQQINAIVPYVNPKYVYLFCNSQFFKNQLQSRASATTVSIVNKKNTAEVPFLLPPLAEQKRIVEDIETIFAEFDEITNSIA